MLRYRSLFLPSIALSLACLVTGLRAFSQPAPADGHALMQSALQLNGLSADGVAPWHLKASYTLTDASGKTSNGTFEEFWAGPNRYKTVITGTGYSETAYATDSDIFRPIAPQSIPEPVAELGRDLTSPLPSLDAIRYEDFLIEQKSMGTAKLACVAARADTDHHKVLNLGQVYCFDAEKPILRLRDNTGLQTRAIYNTLAVYQGHYVASDLRLFREGKPALAAHLDTIEPLGSVNPADLDPPRGGMFVSRNIRVAADVAENLLVHKINPEYPSAAKLSGTVGVVNLEVHIDPNGHVRDVKPLNGPLMLQKPAVDAVSQWLFRPYLIDGEAVNVLTTIHIDFDPSAARTR